MYFVQTLFGCSYIYIYIYTHNRKGIKSHILERTEFRTVPVHWAQRENYNANSFLKVYGKCSVSSHFTHEFYSNMCHVTCFSHVLSYFKIVAWALATELMP